MKRLPLLSCLLLIAAACTTPANSSDYVIYYLDKGFVSHPVNEFFYNYGYAASETELNNGKVYRWSSVANRKPSSASREVAMERAPGDAQRNQDNYSENYRESYQSANGISTAREYCELLIYTDKNDVIRDFKISVDSIGKHSPSRCSELFDRTYP